MKGIILAGGAGTRLYPMTKVISKQLQPVYDKPMIYYPLSLLMFGGVKEILLISTPHDIPHFKKLLGDGNEYGLKIQYAVQEAPRGLPEAFIIAESFIGNEDVCLILGDNLFYGDISFFRQAVQEQHERANNLRAHVFAYPVEQPERYGVVEFDKKTRAVLSIEEKPQNPKSNYAIPGLYIFDKTVSQRAKTLDPSARNELEIVDLIKSYMNENTLGVQIISRGVSWFDTGTFDSLIEASNMIAAIEKRQGLKVACLHEVALRMGFITPKQLVRELDNIPKSPYKDYVVSVLAEFESI